MNTTGLHQTDCVPRLKFNHWRESCPLAHTIGGLRAMPGDGSGA